MTDKRYCIQVYTGDNKGKTSAALGVAIRALGAGMRVTIVAFDKGPESDDRHYMERKILKSLGNVRIHVTGCERMGCNGFRFDVTEEDKDEADRGLALAQKLIREGKQELLILDEILTVVSSGMLKEEDLIDLLDLYNKNRTCELVLTGRGATPAIINRADLVTEMKKIKHYFDEGIKARRGFDF